MDETERKRHYEAVKARRRRRWDELRAKRPPGEVSVYGLASMLGAAVFAVWAFFWPGVFPFVALAACIVVWAYTVAVSWAFED